MNNKKELVKNTIIIFIGRICTQFVSFLLLPIYTYYLTTSDYGFIDLIQTYIALFVPVIALRLDSSVFRFLLDERQNEKNKSIIISNVLIVLLLQIVLFSVLYFIVGSFFRLNYYWLIIFNIIFITASSVLLQISRGIGDNIGYSISCCIIGITTILLNLILVIGCNMAGKGVLVSSGIANAIGCIFLFYRNKLYVYIRIRRFDKTQIKELLKYSLPMIPDGLSWWVISVSDRTIISIFINVAANGIYAVSSKFSNILSSFFSIVNMSWQESASLHINDKDRDEFFSDTINNVLNIFVVLCIGILVCIPLAFDLIIGKDYFEALNYIPILLLANIFNVLAGMLGGIYIAKKLTKEVAKTTVIAAVLNIVINLIFVKWFALYAASISTLISYVAIFIYRYIYCKKFVNVTFNKRIVKSSIIIFIFTTILYYTNNFIGNIINFVVVVIYAILTNKNNLMSIIMSVKKKGKR